MKANNKCWDCNCVIPKERIEFLTEIGVHPEQFTCVKHSHATRIKGIYSGENGTSPIIFCDKVYNDSVRSQFKEIEETADELGEEVDE